MKLTGGGHNDTGTYSTTKQAYIFPGLTPGVTYSIQITADTYAPLNVPQVTPLVGQPEQTITVVLGALTNLLQGTVTALGTNAPIDQAAVIVTNSPTSTTPIAGVPQTSTNAQGYYVFAAVPDTPAGTQFYVRVTKVGYKSKVSDPFTVSGGRIAPSINFALETVTQTVTITVNSRNGFSLTGLSAQILDCPTTTCTVAYDAIPFSGTGPIYTAQVANVAPGVDYKVVIKLPSAHFGTPAPIPLVVSNVETSPPPTVAFDVYEGKVDLKVTAVSSVGNPLPTTVRLTATKVGDTVPTYDSDTSTASYQFGVGTTVTVYLPSTTGNGVKYNLTATPNPANFTTTSWPPKTVQIDVPNSTSLVTGTVPLVDQGAALNLTILQGGTPTDGALTVLGPNGALSPSPSTVNGRTTVTALPEGTYTIGAVVVRTLTSESSSVTTSTPPVSGTVTPPVVVSTSTATTTTTVTRSATATVPAVGGATATATIAVPTP